MRRHTRNAVNCTKVFAVHIPVFSVTFELKTPWILISAPEIIAMMTPIFPPFCTHMIHELLCFAMQGFVSYFE